MSDVRNEMEAVVLALLQRRKPRESKGWLARFVGQEETKRTGCDCALCTMDAMAFALNSLPPKYCLAHHYGSSSRNADRTKVQQVVEKAVIRVGRRPRHGATSPERDGESLRLRNFALERAASALEVIAGRAGEVCLCEDCRADILALALNHLPPRYGVERRGKTRMPPHQIEFLTDELERALERAVRAVSARPRHGRSGVE